LDLDVTTDFLKIEIREKNTMAYGDLILDQEDDIAFGLVDESCTESLPKVDALFNWSKLKSKYEGMMVMTMLSLKRE